MQEVNCKFDCVKVRQLDNIDIDRENHSFTKDEREILNTIGLALLDVKIWRKAGMRINHSSLLMSPSIFSNALKELYEKKHPKNTTRRYQSYAKLPRVKRRGGMTYFIKREVV